MLSTNRRRTSFAILAPVALADSIQRFPDDLFKFVEVDDVASSRVFVFSPPGAKRGGLRKSYDRLSIRIQFRRIKRRDGPAFPHHKQ